MRTLLGQLAGTVDDPTDGLLRFCADVCNACMHPIPVLSRLLFRNKAPDSGLRSGGEAAYRSCTDCEPRDFVSIKRLSLPGKWASLRAIYTDPLH